MTRVGGMQASDRAKGGHTVWCLRAAGTQLLQGVSI